MAPENTLLRLPTSVLVDGVFSLLPLRDQLRAALCARPLLASFGELNAVVVTCEAECDVATFRRFAGHLRELSTCRARGIGRETVLRLGLLLGMLPSLRYLEVDRFAPTEAVLSFSLGPKGAKKFCFLSEFDGRRWVVVGWWWFLFRSSEFSRGSRLCRWFRLPLLR